MHSASIFSNFLLACSPIVSASYRSLPRKYEVRDSSQNTTSMSTSSMTTSSYSSSSISSSSSPSTTPTPSPSSSTFSPISDQIPAPPTSSCIGSVTYFATTPPTVYETVTEPFTVTVTASDAPLTTPAIYTPPPPCFASLLNPAASTGTVCHGACPLNPGAQSTPVAGSAYTSTVFVTKKTPVPTVVPDTSAPPDFQPPSTSTPHTSPTTVPAGQSLAPIAVPGTVSSSPAGTTAAPVPFQSLGSDNSRTSAGPGGVTPGLAAPKGGQTTTANFGSLANSGINVPSTAAAPQPTAANVHGVPVIVLPSSSGVVIGGQVISVPPSGSSTKVVANGNTFTLDKSGIVGPGTTITLAAADEVPATPTPVTANGLTFKVGSTQAIISGKTYAIGAGAPSTTLTIGGQIVVVGPSGVGVPGQTFLPEAASAGPSRLAIITTAGGVPITYDSTEAVIGSTTYRIGPGASATIITVNGKTISLGSSGVGLASSTIPPAPAIITAAAVPLSAVTADGLSLSIDATEVVVGSSTFRIGAGAPTETTVINGKTLTIGPSGVGLGSTTVHPATATATSGGLQTAGAPSAMVQRLTSSFALLLFGLSTILSCVLLI